MMNMERATGVPGPLVAAVIDDKVIIVLIYQNGTQMGGLHNRLDATMTDAIQHMCLWEYPKENTLDTIFRQPTGNAGLVRHSCKVKNKTNQRVGYYFNIPPATIHWASIRGM